RVAAVQEEAHTRPVHLRAQHKLLSCQTVCVMARIVRGYTTHARTHRHTHTYTRARVLPLSTPTSAVQVHCLRFYKYHTHVSHPRVILSDHIFAQKLRELEVHQTHTHTHTLGPIGPW